MSSFKLKPEVFIATSALIDLAVDSGRSVIYAINGYLHYHDLYLIPPLIIASIAGTYIGKKILSKVSDEKFRVFVLFLVLITGVGTLIKFIIG